ncbi:hypothetical protein AXF42_Ash006332 [Apostasia shenzhenica]|uniref:Uncharacterized protein n=1 Tax=Apostasia shenzhenica TaxID=1088818 RepID=A0A2I0AYT6_9ASPA|nr:hypothetical protein AXF42_Ash006332 [Apostasia shenzhenica]
MFRRVARVLAPQKWWRNGANGEIFKVLNARFLSLPQKLYFLPSSESRDSQSHLAFFHLYPQKPQLLPSHLALLPTSATPLERRLQQPADPSSVALSSALCSTLRSELSSQWRTEVHNHQRHFSPTLSAASC